MISSVLVLVLILIALLVLLLAAFGGVAFLAARRKPKEVQDQENED